MRKKVASVGAGGKGVCGFAGKSMDRSVVVPVSCISCGGTLANTGWYVTKLKEVICYKCGDPAKGKGIHEHN